MSLTASKKGGLLNAFGQIGRVFAGHRKHVHSKIAGNDGYFPSDIAQSNNANSLSSQFVERCVPIDKVWTLAPAALTVLLGIVADAVSDV